MKNAEPFHIKIRNWHIDKILCGCTRVIVPETEHVLRTRGHPTGAGGGGQWVEAKWVGQGFFADPPLRVSANVISIKLF